jgi:hypothetical protein
MQRRNVLQPMLYKRIAKPIGIVYDVGKAVDIPVAAVAKVNVRAAAVERIGYSFREPLHSFAYIEVIGKVFGAKIQHI